MVEMKLEYLANELLMEIFEHLTAIDLHAFHHLNSRFDTLILKYFRGFNLHFRSISKEKFDVFIRQYLPTIANQIKSLYLSNNNETPGQIETFFSTHGYSLQNFPYLQSVSISYLHSASLMLKIASELQHLPHLTYLKFLECRFRFNQENTEYILSCIFNQSKLISCHLGIYLGLYRLNLPTSAIISSSLQQLRLVGWTNIRELNSLFHHLSHLQYLRLCFNDTSTREQLTNVIPSMLSLNILVRNSLYTMTSILKNLPNLSHLKIETQSMSFDGYEWEYIISDHLSQLKIFQLKMLITVNDIPKKELQVNNILQSFRSQFWLNERQWYVRCHWNLLESFKTIYLYTLPYAFQNYESFIGMKSQSTCSNNADYYSYNNVHSLNCNNYLSEYFYMHHIYFSRIRHLTVSFPINDYFYSVIPKLDLLISLNVSLNSANDSSHLQVLLDQTPHLYALKLTNSFSIEEILRKNTSRSIRRLDFLSTNLPNEGLWLDSEQCISLTRSSLGAQCEVLLLRVKSCLNILDLIHNMNYLRALNVECADDEWHSASTERDKLVKWLEYSLPTTYTVRRDTYSQGMIQLWIGK